MPKAARAALLAVLALLLAACGEVLRGEPAPTRAPDFRPEQVRRPLVLVRLVRGPGEWEERESRALPDEYQGALLEALNARAVLAREVQVRGERDGRLDAPPALARARELGAAHAVLVEIRVAQVQAVFCRDSRRAFRAAATLWSQSLRVLRAADGAVRLAGAPGASLALPRVGAGRACPPQVW